MDTQTLIQYLITFFSIIAAIIAWTAKLRWSKEYRDATNRLIQAKDAEISTLKSQSERLEKSKDAEIQILQHQIEKLEKLNPKELIEWYEGLKKFSEEYVEQLRRQLEEAKQKIKILESTQKQESDQLLKAKQTLNLLSRDYDFLKASTEQQRIPSFSTVLNSASTSAALSGEIETKPVDIKPFLSFWDKMPTQTPIQYFQSFNHSGKTF